MATPVGWYETIFLNIRLIEFLFPEGEEVKQFAGVVKFVGYRPKSVCFVADDDARTAYNRIGFWLGDLESDIVQCSQNLWTVVNRIAGYFPLSV